VIDEEYDYILVDVDGTSKLTGVKPDLDVTTYPTKFRISPICNEVGYCLEKLNINNEWEFMKVDND